MANPYDLTQDPLLRVTIAPGVWVVIWDHDTNQPVFIGITMNNWVDAPDQKSFFGHHIRERALVSTHPALHIMQDQLTGLNPNRWPTSRRTYGLPVNTSFVNFADIRMAR